MIRPPLKGVEKRVVWGALWRSRSSLDGPCSHIINVACLPVLFRTRQEAKDFIDKNYGYIKIRRDLREEPHGWRIPVPVRVTVSAFL